VVALIVIDNISRHFMTVAGVQLKALEGTGRNDGVHGAARSASDKVR